MACSIRDRIKAIKKLLEAVAYERGYWVPAVKGEMEAELKLLEAEQASVNNKSKRLNIHLKNTPKHSKNIRSNDKNTPEFNKLPRHVDGVKSMTYAGIGSRETPNSVKSNMTDIATKLEKKGYKLQTGKTFGNKEEGADAAFSKGATNKELFAPEPIQVGSTEWKVAQELHPAWGRLTKNWNGNPKSYKGIGGAKLMARNTNQVFGANLDTPVDFVLFYAKETDNPLRPKGGTGQAVEMARRKGIPTINMAYADWKDQLNTLLKKLKTAKVQNKKQKSPNNNGTYEVSSKGDRRFSALYAKFKDGDSVELKWAKAKGYNSIKEAKNKKAKVANFNYWKTYLGIWQAWARENPDLIESLRKDSKGRTLSDKLAKTTNNQARALTEILKNGIPDVTTPVAEVASSKEATLTEDQKVAYNGIVDMLTSKNNHVYMLEGLGGTGKSFTAGKAIKAYVDKDHTVNIIGVATAHTAKDIIGDFLDSSLKDNGIKAKRLVTVQLAKELTEANANKNKTIVVLDEISMIDPVTMDLILAQASKYVKLLIIGDRAQLRPIISSKPLHIYRIDGKKAIYINNNKVPIKENSDGTVSLVGQSKYGLLDNLKFEVIKGKNGDEIKIAKSPLLLKSNIFRKKSSSSINGHVLKEVKRLDTSSKNGEKLLELINNFRYSDVVDNVNEDNSNDLKTQYMEAVSKLKSPGATIDIHKNKEELIDNFRDGTASAFASSNRTVNTINTRLGSKFAAEIGDDAVNMYAQKGMFEEQPIKVYVNFGYSEKMNDPINVDSGNVITNNTNLTLHNVRPISNRGNRENRKSISKVPVGEKFVAGIKLNGNDVITGMRIDWTAVVQNADKEFIDLITVADGTTKDGVVHSDIVLISQPKLEAYLSTNKKLNDIAQLIMKYAKVLVYDGNRVREESPKQAEKTYIQAKDVMDVLGNIRPTYAMTVYKSQGVSVPTAIFVDDLQNNSLWSWGQKLELAYVATSRSEGKLGYVKNFKQELLDTLDAKAEYKANDDIITEVRSAGNELEPSTIDLIMQNIDEYDIPHDDNNNEC